jgi:hypothetical protein
MGETNSKEHKKDQLAWPDMNKLQTATTANDNELDTLESRHRGFRVALEYAACIGRTAHSHPKKNQVLTDAIDLKKAVLSGDMDATRAQMNKTWINHAESATKAHCLHGHSSKWWPVDMADREKMGPSTHVNVVGYKALHDTGNIALNLNEALNIRAALAAYKSLRFKSLPHPPIKRFEFYPP